MAFGDLRGTLVGGAASITNPAVAAGSVAISVDDLIAVVICEQTAITATSCGDNLHGAASYTAQNAGTFSGTQGGIMFYKVVTTAGTLTAVNVAATASTHNFSVGACVFEGPFATPPIDANPANLSADLTSPFACPASGTLVQADELITGWGTHNNRTDWAASAPGTLRINKDDAAGTFTTNVLSWVVSATTTVTPSFTGTAPGNDVLGTATFKKSGGAVAAPQHPMFLVFP